MAKAARKAATKRAPRKATKGRVIAGAATMMGHERASAYGKRIEAAMIKATEDAMSAGVSDPKEILKRKMAARQAVIDESE